MTNFTNGLKQKKPFKKLQNVLEIKEIRDTEGKKKQPTSITTESEHQIKRISRRAAHGMHLNHYDGVYSVFYCPYKENKIPHHHGSYKWP